MNTVLSGKIRQGAGRIPSMRNVMQSAGRWFGPFGLLALVLLTLPNCALPDAWGLPGGCQLGDAECPAFQPGMDPAEAIFCDMPRPLEANDDGCATLEETIDPANISLAEAATALVNGEVKSFALDYSDDAKKQCSGLPKKIKFFGDFPDGQRVCINCGAQMPNPYPTMVKACAVKCQDLVTQNGIIPAEGALAYCEANVKLATNHDPNMCYKGACTTGGNANLSYDDPRKHQEKVVWIDASPGVQLFGAEDNSIKRTVAATGTGSADFNEGAGSAQTIPRGDAWVEFAAGQNGVSHVIGLRESCADPANCPDNDYGLSGIGFAISLNVDNNVYVLEHGSPVVVEGPFGMYAPGERFRVRAMANGDGTTATITYSRVAPGCQDGKVCGETVFWTSKAGYPSYPLRVDATLREENATLENVTIVRIKQ